MIHLILLVSNELGLVMGFTPFAFCCILAVYMQADDIWMLSVLWGTILLLWDLAYRMVNARTEWWVPNRGGHLLFIPIWIYGTCLLAFYVHMAEAKGRWLPF